MLAGGHRELLQTNVAATLLQLILLFRALFGTLLVSLREDDLLLRLLLERALRHLSVDLRLCSTVLFELERAL